MCVGPCVCVGPYVCVWGSLCVCVPVYVGPPVCVCVGGGPCVWVPLCVGGSCVCVWRGGPCVCGGGVPGEKVVSEDEEPSPSQVQKTGRAKTGLSRRAPHDVGVWMVVPGLVPAAGWGGSLGQALNPRWPWQS